MKELDLQDKYLIHFFCERPDGLLYNEAKANTVSSTFFINEDFELELAYYGKAPGDHVSIEEVKKFAGVS